MLYVSLDQHDVKVLFVSKSLLGQYTIRQARKQFSVQLLKAGKISHTDIVASAIKEVVSHLPNQPIKEKEAILILPQEAFRFFRSEVPSDVAPTAIVSFIKDKARASLSSHLEHLTFDYVFTENEDKKIVSLFALEEATIQGYIDTLKLLDMQVSTVLPDSLAFYKLFEKTLRKGKIEHILYGLYEESFLRAYLYDSFGLVHPEAFSTKLVGGKGVEEPLRKIGVEYAEKHHKINRLILSGSLSDKVRQDTFTKEVGIWTNPLKRILPHFYAEYLKMLVTGDNNPFPILEFDVCFGALIFSIENKSFSPTKNRFESTVSPLSGISTRSDRKKMGISLPRIPREAFLFLFSFIGSFVLFTVLTQSPMGFNVRFPSLQFAQKPTPTPIVRPTATPTPTPVVNKETLKIKILNGSGTPGKAGELKTVLKDKGYQDIVTGNADTFDFETTEIAVGSKNTFLFTLLKSDLKETLPGVKKTTLSANETADLVITVGKDFK